MGQLRRPLHRLFVNARNHSISWTRSAQNPVLPTIPELFNPNFLDVLIPPSSSPADRDIPPPSESHPMMDALQQFSHRTRTENHAPAYNSTLSPTLDAFQKLTQYSYGAQVGKLLDNAWAEDPNLTLKIIWNLRSIHDGKSEKEGFYRAFGWLYDNHPRTAIQNLHLLVEPVCMKPGSERGRAHGYWKDILNILALATVDELSNISKPAQFLHKLPARKGDKSTSKPFGFKLDRPKREARVPKPDLQTVKPVIKAQRAVVGAMNHARLERKLADPKYRALYVAVARLFADRLLLDLGHFLESETAESTETRKSLLGNLSLAPKWAPSLLGTHDRHTNIATAISRLIYHAKDALPTLTFPSALANHPAPDGAEATGIMRSFYRRWLLTPLRAASLVTETFMSANRWTEITYSRVSSVCMKNNNKHFFAHDPAGFQKYLLSVEKGDRTISGATLLPHELIARLCTVSSAPAWEKYPLVRKHLEEKAALEVRVLEAQWKTLVQNLRDAGTIENSIAVCDVSGSMGSLGGQFEAKRVQPIVPALSLSLLLAQLARPPFNGGFITFSQNPNFVRLDPAASLYDTVMGMYNAEWGMNTDLQAVFMRLLLPLAIKHKVKPEDMIKRVFVFSDMQFDQGASAGLRAWDPHYGSATGTWETNYDVIEKAFKRAGYEVPQIVYWNLSDYDTVEVLADRKGVALMSGFSPSMLKVFMGEEVTEEPVADSEEGEEAAPVSLEEKAKAEFNPLNIMKKALSRPSFDGLVVVD